MGHKDKSFRREMMARLRSMLSIGRSKHKDKKAHGSRGIKEHIYSWDTFHAYKRWVSTFCDWCKKNGRPTDMASCRPLARGWIQSLIDEGKSPWTIALARSALSKTYGCEGNDIMADIPLCARKSIKRSRHSVGMDARI